MYILFGGWLFHNYEAEAERISAEDYCRSMDLSLKKMEPHQRESFSKVLNNLVNSGLCRAPSCSVAPLDTLSVKWTLLLVEPDDLDDNFPTPTFALGNASELWTAEHKDKLVNSLSATVGVPTGGIKLSSPAVAATDGRRLSSNPSFQALFDITIQGDTEASTAAAHSMLVSSEFATVLAQQMRDNGIPNATTAAVSAMYSATTIQKKTPEGIPMIMLPGEAGSFPASLFSSAPVEPGEPVAGFGKLSADGKLELLVKPKIRGDTAVSTPAGTSCSAARLLKEIPAKKYHQSAELISRFLTDGNASEHGWFASDEGESCSAACVGHGKTCYEDELLAHNSEVGARTEVHSLVLLTKGITMTGGSWSCPASTWASAPNFKVDGTGCYRSDPAKTLANVDCEAVASAGRQRLCYCSPGVSNSTCSSGYYHVDNRCRACPAGKHGTSGAGACASCPKGLYQDETASMTCKGCLNGKYMHNYWETGVVDPARCRACAIGRYVVRYASYEGTRCAWCPAGKFQDFWAQNVTRNCTSCPAGQFRKSGLTKKYYFQKISCSTCSKGRFAPGAGTAKCTWCPTGRYLREKGNTGPCNACPEGKTSVRPHVWCNVPPQSLLLDELNSAGCNTTDNRRSLRNGRELVTTAPKYVQGHLVANLDALNWERGSYLYALTCFTTIGYG
jgi:hypothetical protein